MRWELFSMLINRGLRLTGVYRCWRSYTNERLNGLPTSSSSSRLVARQSTATSGPAPVTMSTGGCQAGSSSENLGNSEPLPHRNLDVCVNILVEVRHLCNNSIHSISNCFALILVNDGYHCILFL